MGRSCSVGECKSGYGSKAYAGHIYGFPPDEEEKREWLSTLPNFIDPNDVTKNMGVCDKHWPPGIPMKKRNKWMVPAVPPSIFDGIPASFQRQTLKIFL